MRFLGTLLAILSIASIATAQSLENCEPPEVERPPLQRAVSLAGLQRDLRNCAGDAVCLEVPRAMYGLRTVEGFVLDPEAVDVVLIGSTQGDYGPLDLDDFIVMLRNASNRYAERRGNTILYTAPGVSIDPRPEVIARLQSISAEDGGFAAFEGTWPEFCQSDQDVRILGVPESHPAAVMLEADYLMKQYVNGQLGITADGYASLSDLSLDAAKAAARNDADGPAIGNLTRFWFAAGTHEFSRDAGTVMIEAANVRLFDEAEFLTRTGEIVSADEVNTLAREFSCAFSRHYREIAAQPEGRSFAQLEDVFRWTAVARLLVDTRAFDRVGLDASWLLDDYPIRDHDMPSVLPGISEIRYWPDRQDQDALAETRLRLILPSCGGVNFRLADIDRHVTADTSGRLDHLGQIVLFYRPDLLKAFWDLFL